MRSGSAWNGHTYKRFKSRYKRKGIIFDVSNGDP